jgi:Cof subfamily protein (haloacid dehalogenase superfamily)
VRRRAVFLDVDGTVLPHDGRLAASTIAAVQGARRAGHLVYLCTGRSRLEIPDAVAAIGFDGAITAGGGYTESGGALVAERTMDTDAVRRIVDFLVSQDIEYVLQSFDAVRSSPGLVDRLRPFLGEHVAALGEVLGRITPLGPDESPTDRPVAKATFFGSTPTTFATVRDGLRDAFDVISGTMPYLGEAGGEISARGVHKGAAITELVATLGVPLADVVAIGDSANDLEMLDVAGVGIAMGNADAAVKARADEVTADVDADGVWTAFVRHGLVPA